MNEHRLLPRWWRQALLILGIWTVPGLIDTAQSFFFHTLRGEQVPLWYLLLAGVADWYVWALLTPFIVWTARRVPLERLSWRWIVFHAVASVCSALFVLVVTVSLVWIIPEGLPRRDRIFSELFFALWGGKLVFYVLTHWLILGIAHGLIYYRKFRERELRALHLETELVQTQLQLLKMQLNPHFLFNTLHAISTLMHRDVELADRMLARLGDLLRGTLDHAGTQKVPLRQELEFIKPYLEIEQARLGPRLSVRFEVDPHTLDALVPNMLLQALVENAIRHGLAPQATPGLVEVRGWREESRLYLQVRDTGLGLRPGPLEEGVGLGNTRRRLQHLYGAEQRLEVGPGPEGGTVVTITVPFREAMPEEIMDESRASKNGARNSSSSTNFRAGDERCQLRSER
jgi:signal transduction histidine kinase